MHFWWVNHEQTFEPEVGKGCIWCPKREKDEARSHFYAKSQTPTHFSVSPTRKVGVHDFLHDFQAHFLSRPSQPVPKSRRNQLDGLSDV
jgi:hypothetical protein